MPFLNHFSTEGFVQIYLSAGAMRMYSLLYNQGGSMKKNSECQWCSCIIPHGETTCQLCMKYDGARIIAQGDKLVLRSAEEIFADRVH